MTVAPATSPLAAATTSGHVYVDAASLRELHNIACLVDIEPLDGGRSVLPPVPLVAIRSPLNDENC